MPIITVLTGVMSKSNGKLLLWLQKHYIHPEFKPNDDFLSILYVFILWDTKGEKLEKQLKLGFIIARTFSVSVVCVNPSQCSLHS
jgi:hypothetical protein